MTATIHKKNEARCLEKMRSSRENIYIGFDNFHRSKSVFADVHSDFKTAHAEDVTRKAQNRGMKLMELPEDVSTYKFLMSQAEI